MRTRKIKSIVSKPSEAVQAMIDGLKNRRGLRINMGTYGQSEDEKSKICYGCAATCTVQQVAGKKIPASLIDFTHERARALSFNQTELKAFENAIDDVRKGYVWSLLKFYNIQKQDLLSEICGHVEENMNLPKLTDNNYLKCSKKYKNLVKYLKQKGL